MHLPESQTTNSTQDPVPHASRSAQSQVGPWTLLEYTEVSSTNLVAAQFPSWHAVRADRQTAGRGRFQRSWVSDSGGLWLSAVVPAQGDTARLLPLAAGLAVAEALQSLGIRQLRLRWPNDVMIGSRKLAGLLVDQFVVGRAVVGIGINCSNRPEQQEPSLTGYVTRISDWLSPRPTVPQVLRCVLDSLSAVLADLLQPETLLPRINALWHTAMPVELDLDGAIVTGRFEGINVHGQLRLILPTGEAKFLEPHEVRLFREIP